MNIYNYKITYRAVSGGNSSLWSVKRFTVLRSGAFLRARWFVFCVSDHQGFQFIQKVQVVVKLQLSKLFVGVPGMLVHVTEPVHVLGIQSYQGSC